MRIAFLIQAHTNVEQISLLAETLSSEWSDVYVHLDRKSPGDWSSLNQENMTLVPRIPVYHGGFSQVQATLNLLRNAIEQQYDHYFLLSGQCFPIKPLSWLWERLNPGCDYINCFPMPQESWEKRFDRLEHFYFEQQTDQVMYLWINRLARRLPKRNFKKGLGLHPYAGSQWWCLRKKTVEFILDYVDRYPKFSQYLSTTSYSDEVFFQSIIAQMNIASELKPALFCADFDPITRRPKVYTYADIPLLDSREVFIARKIDLMVDAAIVNHYRSIVRGSDILKDTLYL
jgi:Core-2/I-Branching enzyme